MIKVENLGYKYKNSKAEMKKLVDKVNHKGDKND